ncbi:MAG: PTS sugar transporter subunit IIA [Planctomycetes bacterium]|nr:PTS sugar transporter subunit IIA [Planctomycetota bacterium]
MHPCRLFLLDYFADIGLYDVFRRSGRGGPPPDLAGHDGEVQSIGVIRVVACMMTMTREKDSIPFSSLFSPAEVICQMEETDRDRALLEMLRLLALRHEIGDVEEAHAAVLARENDLPTVVAPGLAMPHARLDTIDEIAVAVATSRQGIVYESGKSNNRVKLVVLTLAAKTAPGIYLQVLGGLARICQNPATADVVADLPTAEQVWSFFDQGGIGPAERTPAPPGIDPTRVKKLLE